MSSECERCGITDDEYGFGWVNYSGQEFCEQCYKEAVQEDE